MTVLVISPGVGIGKGGRRSVKMRKAPVDDILCVKRKLLQPCRRKRQICDMIKGNESLVEKFQFPFSYITFS